MDEDTGQLETDEISGKEFVSWTKFASAAFLCCCCLVGLYGNFMSVVIFSRPAMKSPINFLLSALSVTDMLLLISVFIVLILPSFHVSYPTNFLTLVFPYIMKVCYPISVTLQTISVYSFVLISIERYLAIVKPLQRHKLMTMNEAKLAQFLIYLVAILYNAVRFWEYKMVAVNVNTTETDSGYMEQYEVVDLLRANHYYYLIYCTILNICTHFLFPFAIIVTCHVCVFRALKRARRQIRNVRRSGRSRGRNRGTTFMIMTVTLAFVFFNVLPLVGDLWEAFDPNLYDGAWMKSGMIVSEISNCLSVLNSSCTFVIYLAYCRKYRRLFLRYSPIHTKMDRTPLFRCESLSTAYL